MREDDENGQCPVWRALELVGDRWTLLIMRDAFDGLRRFGAFQRSLGISKGILAARLKTLVEAGLFQSVAAGDGGAHRDYVLTPKGRELFTVIVGLRQWGEAHCFRPGEDHSVLVDTKTGRPVPSLKLEDRHGFALDDRSTEVRKVKRR